MNGQMLWQRYIEDYGTNISISWEADIWGKIKGRKESALATYLQTQEAAKAVQTQLVAQIAQGHYNLLMLDTQLDITNQNLKLVDNTLRMIIQHFVGYWRGEDKYNEEHLDYYFGKYMT